MMVKRPPSRGQVHKACVGRIGKDEARGVYSRTRAACHLGARIRMLASRALQTLSTLRTSGLP